MNTKFMVLAFVLVLALAPMLGFAAERTTRGEEQACVPQPSQELGIAAISEGVGFIMAGGIGPILMLVIAFVIGIIVSHVFWTSF